VTFRTRDLLHLDVGIDEVHDRKIPEDVEEVLGDGIELAPKQSRSLGRTRLLTVQLGDLRPQLPDLALGLGALELDGEPFLTRREELGLERLDPLGRDPLSQRA
jgi:hypothetical protein